MINIYFCAYEIVTSHKNYVDIGYIIHQETKKNSLIKITSLKYIQFLSTKAQSLYQFASKSPVKKDVLMNIFHFSFTPNISIFDRKESQE